MTWTDERIAALTAREYPHNVRVAVGLDLTIRPDGRKFFTVRAQLRDENGWVKPIRRQIGQWPQMSLDAARAQAVYYRQLAQKGVDFRRSKAELSDLTRQYMAAKHVDIREKKRLQQEARVLRQQAIAEARHTKQVAAKAERERKKQQRQAEREAAKQPPKRKRYTTPELKVALSRQKITSMPWSKP